MIPYKGFTNRVVFLSTNQSITILLCAQKLTRELANLVGRRHV